MCSSTLNDQSIKDILVFQSWPAEKTALVFICSLTPFRPTEWSQCVLAQPNWVDSTVSCLLLTCMTSSSLTEGPASAVLWLSKVVALERMFKQAIIDASALSTSPSAFGVFAFLLSSCKHLQTKPTADEMWLRVNE